MNHKEDALQFSVVKYLQEKGIYFFAVINQAAGRSAVQQMQMCSLGMRKGVSDLVLVLQDQTVYLELKIDDGVQSDAQIKFQAKVESLGHKYFVARSLEDVDIILKSL